MRKLFQVALMLTLLVSGFALPAAAMPCCSLAMAHGVETMQGMAMASAQSATVTVQRAASGPAECELHTACLSAGAPPPQAQPATLQDGPSLAHYLTTELVWLSVGPAQAVRLPCAPVQAGLSGGAPLPLRL